jgi:1-aminocyclopropane-1-carboxylate deaminase
VSLADFERVSLTFGPSPVAPLERLGTHLGGQVEIRLCARLQHVLTDPVYEGKSIAALIDLIPDGRIEPGSRVLYAPLGGQPALNAYAHAF